MAKKKKKKLNKQVAAAIACVVIIGAVGSFGAYKIVQSSYLPAQRKQDGRAAMLKGDYEEAYKYFSKAAGRLTTDMEFLGWFYETALHRTSISDTALRDSNRLLEAMLATKPNDVPTILRRLEFDLDWLDTGGMEKFDAEQAKRMGDLAQRVLDVEPDNRVAIRAQAFSKCAPFLRQDTTQTSADIAAVRDELGKKLEAMPDNADLVMLYALMTGRERELLVRERAIPPGADVPRVKEMLADVNDRIEAVLKAAADASRPAESRAIAYARAAMSDQLLLSSGFIADREQIQRTYERRMASSASASEIVPPTSDMYAALRLENAYLLSLMERTSEAEKVLKDTVAAVPLQLTPRLFLADFYSDRGRFKEALELLTGDFHGDASLTGLAGAQFLFEKRMLPLRRAFFRLQASSALKPDERAKEVEEARKDYELALADQKLNENDPGVMQVKAAFMELNGDRTGAAQLLARALEAGPNDRLKLKLQQQLVSLNLAMNQPGAASDMLEQMMGNPVLSPQARLTSVIQLIDLHIRNNETEAARVLLERAKRMLGADNPALAALEIRLMKDPKERTAALAKIPENTIQQRTFKLKFAGELGDEPTMRRIAEGILKEDPSASEVAMIWGDYLRRNDKRDEAVAVFQAALAKQPDNKTLQMLIRDTQATTPEQREALIGEVLDPYRRALYDAELARGKNDVDGYEKRLLDAESKDANKDGGATERLAMLYMSIGKTDQANQALDRLSKLNRDPASMRVLRARMALAGNKLEDAQAQAQTLTSDLPNYAPGWVLRGHIAQVMNQPSQAIDAYETALGLQPDNLEAVRGIVENAERAGQRDKFKRYIDQGLRMTNNADAGFIDWSLRYELAYGDPSKTIEPRQKMRDERPEDPARWQALAQSYLVTADTADRDNQKQIAADLRSKALDVLTQARGKFPKIFAFTTQAANLVARSGDLQKAAAMIDEIAAQPDAPVELQAYRARFYAEHGQADVALKALNDLVAAGKADNSIKQQLAQLQASSGDTAAALKTLDTAEDTPQTREMRMNLLLASNRVEDAFKMASDALAKERSIANLLMVAVIEANRKHLPEAMKYADEAVGLDGDSVPARVTRARLYLAERPARNNDAVADLQVVAKNAPSNIDARLLLADRLRAIGRRPEAIQEYETLARDFVGDRRVAVPLIQLYAGETPPRYSRIDQMLSSAKAAGGDKDPELLLLESSVAVQRGDNQRAIASARAATKLRPNDEQLFRDSLRLLLRANALDEVIQEADAKQKENTSLYWTYLNRGKALHRLKREEEAAKEFDRAVGLAQAMNESSAAVLDVGNSYAEEYGAEAAADWIQAKLPDDANTKLFQMRLLMDSGKMDKAIAVGEQIMRSVDSLPKGLQIQVLSTMGTAYISAQPPQADNARTVFGRLNEIEPNNMMTLNNLAYAMTLSGTGPSMQEAVDIARKANELSLQTAQPNPFIMDTYGWTLVQAGKWDEGLTVLRQASEAGALPETDYHLGETYILQSQKEAALASLQSATSKLNEAEQAGKAPDTALKARIDDAVKRAKLLP